jgi:S1-C subfamily serine protease
VRRPKLAKVPRDVETLQNQVRLPVTSGVLIWWVQPGGPAANAGLRGMAETEDGDIVLGDIIVGLDGEKINNNDDIYRALNKHQLGDSVSVEVFRNGTRMTVQVRLTEVIDPRRNVRE